MSGDRPSKDGGTPQGPLSEDVHLTLVGGPEEYGRSPVGPVRYIAYCNPAGAIGYLWMAADGSDNAGCIPSREQGYRAINALGFWIERMREAKARGLTPEQALNWLLDSQVGGMPFPGRVLPRSGGEVESLDTLRAQIKALPEVKEPPYLCTYAYSRRIVESDGRQRLLVPKITDDMRKSTVLAPGKRMIAIDPEYPLFSSVPVPREGIVGDWQIDQDGGFGDFVRNRHYRPTPTAVGMLRAENTVERAVQLRLLGRITEDELLKELRSAQVLVPVEDDGSTPRLRERGPGGRPFLLMYTGARHAPQGGEHCRWMNAAEVAGRMINLDIEIDEGSAACLDIAASKVAVSPFG
ncbi:hypothetical protein HEP86_30695 [Streptomyces sp. RPA4-5]|uniref:hypothetical protein n=1 Tax=Streptomyces TaxID=1883 RepID=UPI00143E4798|nr:MULTISPECIES: hypothetical protein [Streptomyces]MCX4634808.1 hypothetical protein [Streptomyces platensis]QIY58088.1 hypothetical protein HEP86_30695 [Streptomyces sp. RPA4-5]